MAPAQSIATTISYITQQLTPPATGVFSSFNLVIYI